MREPQTAFAIWYPFDDLVADEDNLETALATIAQNERFVAEGIDDVGETDIEIYANSYIVLWNGEEWVRFYGV